MVGERIVNNWILENLLRLVLWPNIWSILVSAFEKKCIVFSGNVFIADAFDQSVEN